jgi:catechol 2,3-dioxygenase
MKYTVPETSCIGHTHLKVSDLEKSLAFYRDILGFQVTQYFGNSAVFLSAGGYHHHIGLNTWHSKNARPAPINTCGLYHMAILYPSRKELALVLQQLITAKYPLTGAADHGVSEALYMNDPDGNGVELYRDKPKSEWPYDAEGNLMMVTDPLDLDELLKEIQT